MLGEQAGKVAGAIVVPPREVAVLRAWLLHLEVVHDDLLAGVDTDLVLPAGADGDLIDHDLHLLRRRGVGPIRSWHTLDAEHLAGDARPTLEADVLGEVAAFVHEGHRASEPQAVLKAEYPVEHHLVQLGPGVRVIRPAHDDALFNTPGFPKVAVPDDLVLHAVILGVHAGGEHQHPLRQLHGGAVRPGAVILPAGHEAVLVLQVAAVFPQQAEAGVVDHLELPGVADRLEILEHDGAPGSPLADKGVQPEGADALGVCVGVVRLPARGLVLHGRLVGDASAAGADIPDVQHLEGLAAGHHALLVLIADVLEVDLVVLAAVGAFAFPPLHRALGVGRLDCAGVLDGGGADLQRLGVVERGLSGLGQLPGVALVAGGGRPAVALIPHDVADGLGRQGVGLGGAAHRQDAAGVCLLQDGVSAVAALGVRHLLFEGGAVPDHRSDTELGVLLGVNGRGVDEQDGAGVLVDDIADGVVEELRLSHLGRRHHDDAVHPGVGKSVHRLPEVRGAVGAPGAGLGAGLGGQAAVFLRPFRHGQVVRRFHAGQDFRDDGIQPLYPLAGLFLLNEPARFLIRHRHHARCQLPRPSAPGRAPRISLGHSGSWRAPAWPC